VFTNHIHRIVSNWGLKERD